MKILTQKNERCDMKTDIIVVAAIVIIFISAFYLFNKEKELIDYVASKLSE